MSLIFGITICVILVPTLLILFYILYPKNWKNAKLILGLSMRKEYTEGDTSEKIDKLYNTRRGQAAKILIVSIALSIILLLFHGFVLQTTIWMLLFFGSIIGINIPFAIGNKEMKNLKRMLGFTAEKISYTDINTAGNIRTVKISKILIPNILGFIVLVAALLIDLKVIAIDSEIAGNFLGTGICAIFWVVGILISILAYGMDGLKNEVISSDSTVNANYNRAKKKNLSNFIIGYLWLCVVLMVLIPAGYYLMYSELAIIIGSIIYIIILMAGIFLYSGRAKKIEARYRKEMTIVEDEDDNWIGGFFYYNPNNRRLMVNKRVGVGATINIAHPVGKLLCTMIVIWAIVIMGTIVYIGMAEATPIKLKVEDNRVICHQLSDEYIIDIADIKAVEWGDDVENVKFFKESGFGIATLYKGNFTVDGENGCKVFLNPEEGSFIKIVTSEQTYYISSGSREETRKVYDMLINP